MNVLRWLRGRNRAIGGALLPILAAVWLSASASHCFGMAAAGASDGHTVAANHHAGDAGEHSHSHAPPEPAPANHEHGNCPHCPPSPASLGATSPEHLGCATLADGTPVTKTWKPDLKGGPQLASFEVVSEITPRPPPRPPPHSFDYHRPDIPLNLRHCVFLI